MRNLKRALSLTLASVMLLGMMVIGTSAASFNDADDISNVTAATILQEIGVMLGDDKGNFGPDQIVTRGQMAIIVCKLLYGDKLNVTQFEGSSQYIDVPVGHYANGYVNLASSLGIINGYGNGYFGPSDPVTTAQAALMLSKALGYYKYNELTGNWAQDSLTAITKATQLTMFEGIVPPTANEGLTRDNVAVMAFNTLTRATPVQFNTIVNEYYTVGGSLTTGVEYIDAYEYGRNSGEYTHTLGYTIYGLYISNRNDTDDFDRPADEWSYEKGGVIGSFNDEPIKVFTEKVTSKALYDAIGKNAVDAAMDSRNPYSFNVSLNGVPMNYTPSQLNDNKNDDNDDFYKKTGGAKVTTNGNSVDKLTDNGVITEVYVDGADRRVDVVVYDVYPAEVYSAKDGKVTLADLFSGPAETDDEFEAVGFAEDQVVIYTYANQKIQSVSAAEKLEGEVTRVRANTTDSEGDNFNVDGKTYSYNRNIPGAERLTTENVDNNVVAYLDANDYAIYIDESAVTYEYAYVLSTKENDDSYGTNKTVNARLVLTDGSILKVETDDDTASDSLGKIVAYSANKNDVYALTQKDNKTSSTHGTDGAKSYSAANVDIFKNGRATFVLPAPLADGTATFTANSNTIVIVADSDKDPDDYSFTVFTGVKNIPDITSKTPTTVGGRTIQTWIDVAADEKGVAKVVYIEDADVSGVGDVIYLRADTKAKLVQASGDNKYYEISAVVNGKVDTLMVKESSEAAKILRTNAASLPTQNVEVKTGEQYIAAVKSLTYDSNGLVTNVKFFDNYAGGDGTNKGEGTRATKNDVAFLLDPTLTSTNSYPWTDDATVVRYNVASGKFAVSTMNSIKDDTNDKWVSVADDYSLTGVCVIEVKGGEGTGTTTPSTPDVSGTNVKLPNGSVSGSDLVIKYYDKDGEPSKEDIEKIASDLAGVQATANKVSNKVTFADGTEVGLVLKPQIAVKIGSNIIGYADKGNNTDVANDSLTVGDVYLPKGDVVQNTAKYEVVSGKKFASVNSATDVELVKAHALTIGGVGNDEVALTYGESDTVIAHGKYVQDGTTVTITGKLATGYSRLTQTTDVGGADEATVYLTGTMDGKKLSSGKENSATISVSEDVTLGEVAVYSVKVGSENAKFYEDGAAVTVTAGQKYAVNVATGTKTVASANLVEGTTASGATTWAVDDSKATNGDIVLTPVTTVAFTGLTVKDDNATTQATLTDGDGVVAGTVLSISVTGDATNDGQFVWVQVGDDATTKTKVSETALANTTAWTGTYTVSATSAPAAITLSIGAAS